jgi:two-component system NtrC family sensor kinase
MSANNRPGFRSLGLKLTLLLAFVLSAILLVFSTIVIGIWKQSYVDSAITDTERFSDTIKRSAEQLMLKNQVEEVHQLINNVGKQKDVEWVRIFNKEGKVTYSTVGDEIGSVLDKNAQACFQCHGAGVPVEKLTMNDRSRIIASGKDGHRVLATINPIYNAPACFSCHPESKQVLGVLDVAVSLAPTDEIIRERTVKIAAFGIGAVVLVCVLVAFFLQAYVGRPVRKLLKGTQKVADGDFDTAISIKGRDEVAELAGSFNKMTVSLKDAYKELHDLNATLERRVDEKTRELKSAQMQVVRAEKLASLGTMAAGVAHELNNPLTGVLTFAHLIRKKLPEGSQERADVDVVIGETNRCSKIIKDLLQFARETQVDRKAQKINDLVRQTIAIVQPQSQFHDVRFELNLDEGLPPMVLDAAQIKQVLMNLIFNAADAMPQGGTLTLSTSARPGVDGKPGHVVVSVADTGCGIAPENLGKIFDPFFTTKDPGKGTGLGLSVSLKLAENHGGTIEVARDRKSVV